MGWTENSGIDYEDAKRPTVDDPSNATGWIAYYAWGRDGCGMHAPEFLYSPDTSDFESLRDYIVSAHESWMEHAERASIAIHRGVTPPAEIVIAEHKRAAHRVHSAQDYLARMTEELAKYAPPPGATHD